MIARTSWPRLLFVDAYDSFAENIIALLSQLLQADVTSIKIDSDLESEFGQTPRSFLRDFDAIVLGPGPGHPNNATDVGLFESVWQYATADGIPVLGICLGFQSLCQRFGLSVTRMPVPCHGHPKVIYHSDQDIFHNTGEIMATCYNSLGVRYSHRKPSPDSSRPSSAHSEASTVSFESTTSQSSSVSQNKTTLVDKLINLAWDENGYLMSVRHAILPFWGVQFHPESCKSNDACQMLLKNWWTAAQKHNQAIQRSSRVPVQNSLHVESLSEYCFRSADYTKFRMHLEQFSRSYNHRIKFRTTSIKSNQQDIATLCRNLSQDGSVALLESTKKGRFSIFTFSHKRSWGLEYKSGVCTFSQQQHAVNSVSLATNEFLDLLHDYLSARNVTEGNPNIPFWGGFVGFMSYEMGTDILNIDIQMNGDNERSCADCSLLWSDRSIVVDHLSGIATIQSMIVNDELWIDSMIARIEKKHSPNFYNPTASRVSSILRQTEIDLPQKGSYIAKIHESQDELHAGNSYELCLTTEALIRTPIHPLESNSWHLYNNLKKHNPVPFAAYLELNNTTIISSSPEQFLSWSRSSGTIDMVPMKGTVRKTPEVSFADAAAILSTPKEMAENLMIADLIRHDLQSTVGRNGVVEVAKLCEIVEHETVYQLVSHIRAHIPLPAPAVHTPLDRRDIILQHGIKALQRSLPPGSMTGAPKKRSCEILSRLENRNRGIYSGVIGFLDVGGGGSWSVCIRSVFSHKSEDRDSKQTWHVGAGGAITVLSDEEQEWEEMKTKLDSVLRAFRLP